VTTLVSDEQVRAHFSLEQCIGAVERAFAAAGQGGFDVTERKLVAVEGGARLLSLTAASSELGRLVANIYSGAPAGGDKRRSTVNQRQKLYVLFDAATGACEAIIGGAYLSRIKTGAMGAVGIRHLSSPTARTLAIIGSGRQARAALNAAVLVRDFDDIRVWSRSPENAGLLARDFEGRHPVKAVGSAREAVEGAEVVVTATTAPTPVVLGKWLAPGCHVNSIGAHYPNQRELDTEAVRRSTVVVDTLVAARAEKGELLIAEEEGRFGFEEIVAELGQVVAGTVDWRRSASENTMFASCGSAIESIGAALGALLSIPETERKTFTF
jgi:alanine dehydrogenase